MSLINSRIKNCDGTIVYRGHASTKYKMLPSLFREENEYIRKHEYEFLSEIETFYPSEFSSGMSILDKLVKLQHYGFPTRLLDVSINPLVALHFAADSSSDYDGAVILCKITESIERKFDSKDVICRTLLSHIPYNRRQDLETLINELVNTLGYVQNQSLLSVQKMPGDANMTRVDTKPEHTFITDITNDNTKFKELPKSEYADTDSPKIPVFKGDKKLTAFFRDVIRTQDASLIEEGIKLTNIDKPVYVRAKHTNERIKAQDGSFLLFGTGSSLDDIEMETVIIHRSAKSSIIHELDALAGINTARLFPEFSSYLRYVHHKHMGAE